MTITTKLLYQFSVNRYPSFKNFRMEALPLGLKYQAENPIFYTPLIQLKIPSSQFRADMRIIKRKNIVNTYDLLNMTQRIIKQYTDIFKIQEYQYLKQKDLIQLPMSLEQEKKNSNSKFKNQLIGCYRDYVCKPNPDYGGKVQFMLHCRNFKNFVPILFFEDQLNLAGAIVAAIWTLNNRPWSQYGYSLQTNGNCWQMVRINKKLAIQKTILYQPNNLFKKLYQDQSHQELVLGLIEESLELDRQNKMALQKVYEFLDYKVYANENQKNLRKQESIISQIIQRFWRR